MFKLKLRCVFSKSSVSSSPNDDTEITARGSIFSACSSSSNNNDNNNNSNNNNSNNNSNNDYSKEILNNFLSMIMIHSSSCTPSQEHKQLPCSHQIW